MRFSINLGLYRESRLMARSATLGTDIPVVGLKQLTRKYYCWYEAEQIALGTDMMPPDIARLADELYRPKGLPLQPSFYQQDRISPSRFHNGGPR